MAPISKYWAGPTLLNYGDQTRTGVFSVVWSYMHRPVGIETP